jgi:hypothetical protein
MINYSSINDAWGKKEIYKKKPEIKSQSEINEIKVKEKYTPEQVTKHDIKKNIFIESLPNEHYEHNEHNGNYEHFSSCNVMEHITNCPECKNKFMKFSQEMFSQTNNTITLPGCNIKISRDALKIIFILIIISIILLFISIINEKKAIPMPAPAFNKYMYMPYNYSL